MKNYFFLIICILISFSFATDTYLVRTPLLKSTSNSFKTIYISDSYCLIHANEMDIQKLRQTKAPLNVLETNPEPSQNSEYYAVHPDKGLCPAIDPEKFAGCGKVLDIFEGRLIIKGLSGDIHNNAPCPLHLEWISFKPISALYESRTIIPERKPVSVDPLIEEMISKVSPDSCARLLRDLCGIFNRSAANPQWNKETLVPYMEKKFREYGCDSVDIQEVPDWDAPNVIGVKKGKKNPSLKEFCLIGAHIDNIRSDDYAGQKRHQGAYDNGCGDVGVLEVARVLKDYDFENTIVYVGFNVEERGLKGTVELIDHFNNDGCKIIGGAVTYDMLGIGPGSSTSISHRIYSGCTGAQDFFDRIEYLGEEYDFPVAVSMRTSSDIPTDTKIFWQNGYVASIGGGGEGGGQYHTAADSITSIFDSTWLAKAIIPGVAIIADYAVPMQVTPINFSTSSISESPINVYTNSSGFLTISFSNSSQLPDQSFHIYNIAGKLIQTISINRKAEGQYTGIWGCCDTQCNTVGAGLYLIVGIIENERFQKKVVIR